MCLCASVLKAQTASVISELTLLEKEGNFHRLIGALPRSPGNR